MLNSLNITSNIHTVHAFVIVHSEIIFHMKYGHMVVVTNFKCLAPRYDHKITRQKTIFT
jgi:hypothetical protein